MGKQNKDEIAFQSLLKALNDLAKGQREIVDILRQQIPHSDRPQDNKSSNGGSNASERIGTSRSIPTTNPQSHPRIYSGLPRSTMPKFLPTSIVGRVGQDVIYQ